ncbi:MAG TPA: ferritin family protein [Thermotogota bacterium]|nr:ferritin family protein [Thermotogota bacterium]HPJ89313.1 ferritin family protein [Thermotogota bacterium]HPR95184.1 ferritin family protein [Thermotogota bacterium]
MSRIMGILQYALAREEDGRSFYLSQIDKVKDKEIKRLFEYLAEMESDHVDYIASLIEAATGEKGITKEDILPDEDSYFKTREKTELPAGRHAELASDISILRMAYLIEHDFMEFYQKAADETADEGAKFVFNHLSAWEKGHRDMILELYDERMKAYWD